MPLGSILRRSEAVLGGLGPPKPKKTERFFKVFANAGFWVFEALDWPRVPI